MNNKSPMIALMGNPNSGKTAIFNLLTGMNQKVSNYPGITVEQRRGNAQLSEDFTVQLMDMPGTYSLTPESLDEKIVAQQTLNWQKGIEKPSAIISVVDATNLSRNLYLTSQVLELGIPVIIVLNMMDRVQRKKQKIDIQRLQKVLGVTTIVPMSAREKWGIDELQTELINVLKTEVMEPSSYLKIKIPNNVNDGITPISEFIKGKSNWNQYITAIQTLRIITRKSAFELYCECENLSESEINSLTLLRDKVVIDLDGLDLNHRILESTLRYEMLDKLLKENDFVNIEFDYLSRYHFNRNE